MTTQDVKQLQAQQQLFSGVMQYFSLPPKKERDARRLAEWFAEPDRIFGFNRKGETDEYTRKDHGDHERRSVSR